MSPRRRLGIIIISLCLTYVTLLGFYAAVNRNDSEGPASEDSKWIATSPSALDRVSCRWIGICGGVHWTSQTRWWRRPPKKQAPSPSRNHDSDWYEASNEPYNWPIEEQLLREIPQYIFDYAPFVHLHSEEQFWPTDIAEHLDHVAVKQDYTLKHDWTLSLKNLSNLNDIDGGKNIYLTSIDDPEEIPHWLSSTQNIPEPVGDEDKDSQDDYSRSKEGEATADHRAEREGWYEVGDGGSRDGSLKTRGIGGRSKAPAFLLAVDKGKGVVDAFWFYFYAFNLGQKVLNIRFGNHVGDWEHSMVRFQNGTPKAIFLSEHNFGSAYSYEALEKRGKRPVIYSAIGSHAMYPNPGTHSYILPLGLLHDETNRGPLWDPVLNLHSYIYDYKNNTLLASTQSPHSPTSWFDFVGHWGDKVYPLGDSRQYRFAGQYHYADGPVGPQYKNLGRKRVCEGAMKSPCIIRNWREEQRRVRRLFEGDSTE